MRKRLGLLALVAILVAGCATSPLGRRQLQLFPEDQMQSMGVQAYQQMQEKTPTVGEGEAYGYVRCVADAITAVLPEEYAKTDWEVTVFRSDDVNAFALPGGKIGVYTGLLRVADNADQLAAVIGHEVGHVMAHHGNERMSTQFATTAGLTVLQVLAGGGSREKQQALGLLGLGAQVGVLLPFSRTHESEADLIGIDLMAKAGFDPHASVELWKNMAKAGGEAPPELLSTHPSHSTRIDDLGGRMDRATKLYERAQAEGRQPDCRKPENIPSGDEG